MKNALITKEQEVHGFEFILETSLVILMWWQYFLFSEWMLEQCICLLKLLFMNVKYVGSWKNDEKGEMLFDNLKNHKNDSWSKKKQWIQKLAEKKYSEKKRKKKKKQAEKAKSSLNQKARAKSQ